MSFPMIDLPATGRNIDHLMQQRKLSVRTLQTYFGFDTPRAIYKWLRGEHLPSVDHLFALSKLLHTPIQDILIEADSSDQDVPPIGNVGKIPLRVIQHIWNVQLWRRP